MKTKTFDCVEMKRRGAAAVQEGLATMTPGEELEFSRRQADELRRLQSEIRQHGCPQTAR